VFLTLAACAAAATWYFWPLLHEVPAARPGPGWTPSARLIAGTGIEGQRDGDAFAAAFSDPFAVAFAPDGSLYVADAGDSNAIRRITPAGDVGTVAGGVEGFADGLGHEARFNTPSGLVVDRAGVVYVADTGNNAIRRIDPSGRVTTVAGDGIAGYRDGPGSIARFDGPIGIAIDVHGRLLVSDTYNDRVRAISLAREVTTLAGEGVPGLADGPTLAARFDTPTGLAVANDGAIFVADTGNELIRRIGPDGLVSTVQAIDVSGNAEGLVRPIGLAVSPSDGRLFVTDRRGRIVEMTPMGVIRTLAGSTSGYADGDNASVRFRAPTGLAIRPDGAIVVADAGNRMIRLLDLPAPAVAMRPAPPGLTTGFDLSRFSALPLIWPLDPQGGPHEVAGTFGEARGNPGGTGHDRFHAGVDVHGEDGELVLAVRDGKVDQPIPTGGFGSLNEYLAIGPITYVHMRAGRDRLDGPLWPDDVAVLADETGKPARMRVRRGWRVHAGQEIGTVNRFRHVHLTVGPLGEEINPLECRLPNFVDTIAPAINPRGIELVDVFGQVLKQRQRGRLVVSTPVNIVVDAWDRVDGNAASRRLGVYSVGYQVLQPDGRPVADFETPRMTVRFDRLPADPAAPLTLYAPGSGIPFYGTRRTRFKYLVTSGVDKSGRVVEVPWDASALPPGDYVLRVIVQDAAGNQATAGRDVRITRPG
jgi:DNA-binding beta-propeller fold protein YncE